MERGTPVRKPHTSTADLLTWSEIPPENTPATASATRSHQPSDGISKVVFGGQVTDEEVESLNKRYVLTKGFVDPLANHVPCTCTSFNVHTCFHCFRKPCSGYKMKEMTGSGIFKTNGENGSSETEDADQTSANKTGLRMYQQVVGGVSQISFGEEEDISPKKPATLPEVAKQRELSGNLESESEAKLKKQFSDAKSKELSGHDIFAPPPEILPRPLAARALALRESITIGDHGSQDGAGGQNNGSSTAENMVKTAKKIPNQKFTELSGNDIFKGDAPPASAEKPLSSAKLREMSGSNIFADGKVESRDFLGGVRKPPGGESSIALV